MCKSMEDMRNEAYREGEMDNMKKIALRMLKTGKFDLENIAELSGMSIEELQKMKKNTLN